MINVGIFLFPKMEEKQYFHPLEEHRHWCPWVKKIDDDSSNEESSQIDDKRGYHIVVAKVRTLVNLSLRKDLYSSEKYAKNVQGLRSIRNMLNELSSGDQLEDVGEK
ncbi:putative Rsm1-like-containing protein [Homarus americanus]|uniref:Putative Rsm1-like-containing protein n=1 Tax=Homarus americanus TaxID=6706 RepID=A0A8J5K5W0_HOMAM|nr:putative Rsm1-like-containing protein [Homarus americanus]